jgi:hypothetical protein
MTSLKIPRVTKEFVRDGLQAFDHYTFYEPEVVLNFHFPDIVLFTLLAHVKKPKHILDLGSYFGILPFVVEEISRINNCPESFNWTMVDNCLYTKELAGTINGDVTFSNRYLNRNHLDSWHENNVPKWKENVLFKKVGEYYLPPSTTLEFERYWSCFATHYKVPKPSMKMFESIDEVKDTKFDLVHFDLTAGASELNRKMFHLIAEHKLNDDGIIVFDDMRPQHPKMLVFFQYILATSDFRPVAFSTGKIAMMRKKYKPEFIFKVDNAGLREVNHTRDNYFSFAMAGGEETDWGDFLDLRAN